MGPIATVIFPNPLAPDDVGRIQDILKEASGIVPYDDELDDPFTAAGPFGTYRHPSIDTGIFEVSRHDVDSEVVERDRAAVEAMLTWYPADAIHLWAGTNDTASHRILGQSTLGLVESLGGLIDLCGALTPPLPAGRRVTAVTWPWSTLDEVSEYVHGLPGRVLEKFYETANGPRWVSHTVDAEFMRAWLRNPDFHMIK